MYIVNVAVVAVATLHPAEGGGVSCGGVGEEKDGLAGGMGLQMGAWDESVGREG